MTERTLSGATRRPRAATDGTACDFIQVTTRPETDTVRGRFDPTTATPSLAVVELVGRLTGTDRPDALPQLYDSVNPEALDELFADGRADGLSVGFEYAGYSVTVREGRVSVAPAE